MEKNWWFELGRPSINPRARLKVRLQKRLIDWDGFYTYILWRTDKDLISPFYVGKGRNIASADGTGYAKDRHP
jgi:hypothetical protein